MLKSRFFALALMLPAAIAIDPHLVSAADAPAISPAAEKPAANLALDKPAPEIDAATLAGKPVKLASLVGKPIVLQFGSLTEPVFRARVADVEKMAARYGDKVAFLLLYQRESHPADTDQALELNSQEGFAITRPVNQDERIKLAAQTVDRLKITHQQVLVDAWSNTSSLRYGDYPNMTFVIDAKGNLQAGYAWLDPAKLQGALDALLAGKPVPPEFRGKTQASAPAQPDLADSGNEMSGGRGGTGLASAIDRLDLTQKQKEAIYPALAQFMAESRSFREKHGGAGGAAAVGGAPGTPGQAKQESPEEFKKAVEDLRAAAQKLKHAVQENLSADDARQIMDILDRGPAHRLFAD